MRQNASVDIAHTSAITKKKKKKKNRSADVAHTSAIRKRRKKNNRCCYNTLIPHLVHSFRIVRHTDGWRLNESLFLLIDTIQTYTLILYIQYIPANNEIHGFFSPISCSFTI